MTEKYQYRLFGGVLESDVAIPELVRVADAIPDWTLESVPGPVPIGGGELLGSAEVTGDVRVHLYRRREGLRMIFDDTGCFDIDSDARQLTWYHSPDVTMADARADLTNRVLAAVLYVSGTVCLHGSAVVVDDGAIGFVAPKRHGKSTLALALVRSGARLLTDDTLPIIPGDPAMARPGVHAARLWPDSAARVGIGRPRPHEHPEGLEPDTAFQAKQLFADLGEGNVTHDVHPLRALYMLSPSREPRDGAPVWRTPLNSIESALTVIGHAKLAGLLTGTEAPQLFMKAATLSSGLPMYRLGVVRDLDRLDEVVDTIRSWHTRVPASAIS